MDAVPPETPLPPRIRLVVLFGGRSAEHDVSCVSASHVLRAVDPDRYDIVPIGITREGRWVLAEQAAELLARRTGGGASGGPSPPRDRTSTPCPP